MGSIRIGPREALIKPQFGKGERMLRDKNTQSRKPWLPNGHKEGLGGLDSSGEVLNSPFDEIASWKCL